MNVPSRGRKQCAGCKNFVGVRTQKCECGFEFKKKEEVKQEVKKQENNKEEEVRAVALPKGKYFKWGTSGIIHGAAGNSPIKLNEISKESISEFAKDLINLKPYAPAQVERFAKDNFPSDKWKEIDKLFEEFWLENNISKELFQQKPSPIKRQDNAEENKTEQNEIQGEKTMPVLQQLCGVQDD